MFRNMQTYFQSKFIEKKFGIIFLKILNPHVTVKKRLHVRVYIIHLNIWSGGIIGSFFYLRHVL